MDMTQILKTRFDLELTLLQAQRKLTCAKAALKQAKFDLRNAQQTLFEYSGSFKSFLDKVAGRQEEKETALRHAVQRAQADLDRANADLSAAEDSIARTEQSLSSLPAWDSLKTPQTETIWFRLEALRCIEEVLPLLEVNHALLLERRNQNSGANAGQLQTRHEIAEIYSAPEKAGNACKPYLTRLESSLETMALQLPAWDYFRNPPAFLNSATKFTRMDRLNDAIAQTESMLRAVAALKPQLQQE